jgi:hypothetical protein
MFDPLGLLKSRSRMLHLSTKSHFRRFRCVDFRSVYNYSCPVVARYTLEEIEEGTTIELEVCKDRSHNFHIYAYSPVETKPFNISFLSVLGTDSIGFVENREKEEVDATIYRRILHSDEKLDIYKYYCDEEELERSPYDLGYSRDGSGRWYMLMSRSQGVRKHFFNNETRRCWEYESDAHIRLLIELNESSKEDEKRFYIYKGEAIKRDQIQIVEEKRYQKSLFSFIKDREESPLLLQH